ncbi:hypothetical protein TrVE_jg4456 [Triparma verrucosa]|uniref:PPIase cyclophilin-type domain-containing protein n=1 Tax=Triparma verrucosa TaxID=1606542 RepID=A0A9W7FDK6_9STRA|nr:hypothetical protein TrVE_jg4456 [Triparma verrucosa]
MSEDPTVASLSPGDTLCKMVLVTPTGEKDLWIELKSSLVPHTCSSFLSLPPLPFVRLLPSGFLQSSVPPLPSFPDESFSVPFTSPYTLAMSSSSPHTSNGQFFITLQPQTHLEGKFVAFGTVVKGGEALEEINEIETVNERPEGISFKSITEITE